MPADAHDRCGPGRFCFVERRSGARSRFYVVHARAPRVVVEMEVDAGAKEGRPRGVIRRVALANSWSGHYHLGAGLLGAALASFENFLDVAEGADERDPDVS